MLTTVSNSRRSSSVIAMQRTLFVHRFYTNPLPTAASVVIERTTNGYSVEVSTEMKYPYGTGYRSHHVGDASSFEDGLAKWGFVEWREDGLFVGKGSNEFFVPKKELEAGGR
jgi:hypothetical protein